MHQLGLCRALPVAALLLTGVPAHLFATDAVVGNGTAASCDETALIAAVAAANSGGGTITFACGTEPVTIALTGNRMISAAVTLDGDRLVTLSGGDVTRHFVVVGGAVLTLRELALVHGEAAGGGAVLVAATGELHLFDCEVSDNHSTSTGGAIQAAGGVVHAVRSRLAGNSAAGAGGAIHLSGGRLDVAGTLLHGNSAGGPGGAVAIDGCNQLAVFLSSIDGNAATGDGGGMNLSACFGFVDQSQVVTNTATGKGGGLHLAGGSSVSLSQDTVGGNVAAEGGGIFLAAGTSSIEREVTLSANRALASGARGGAIANLGALELENATVSGNSSAGAGGGLHSAGTLTLRFATIAWNSAATGGGLDSSGTTAHLRNVVLAGNLASASGDECAITGGSDIAASLWQGTSCGTSTAGGNQPATDALLAALEFSCPPGTSGELTRTHDLDPTSPAIDAGIPLAGGNAFMDQRTVLRPQGTTQDVGAVEYSPSSCPWFFRDGFERGNTFAWSSVVW